MSFKINKRRKLPDYVEERGRLRQGKWGPLFEECLKMKPGTHIAVTLDSKEEARKCRGALSAKFNQASKKDRKVSFSIWNDKEDLDTLWIIRRVEGESQAKGKKRAGL